MTRVAALHDIHGKLPALEIPGVGDVLFCHATPRNDTEIFTRFTPEDRVRRILALERYSRVELT